MKEHELVTKIAEEQVRLKQNEVEQKSNESNADKIRERIAGLKAELAEAKKPRLTKDGDFSSRGKDDYFHIMLDGVIHNCYGGENPSGYDPATDIFQGNIIDDLKAMQEDVTEDIEFKFKDKFGQVGRILMGCNTVHFRAFSGMILEQEDLDTFILKLRQMQATLKRQEAKK